ncbi:MAG: Membrane protein involved in colicin uptake [Candidatus Saccharibacteria bacterium]|nr:Membrane protein involved in colicin uptake [Candidatus Saccharibacteria bacterium]
MNHEDNVTEVREVRETSVGNDRGTGSSVLIARIIYFIFGVIIAFIAVRFILLLLGANQGNAFVDFVYGVSGLFVAPFYGIFNNTPAFGASIIDVSSIVAIIIYALISWGLVSLVTLGSRNRAAV